MEQFQRMRERVDELVTSGAMSQADAARILRAKSADLVFQDGSTPKPQEQQNAGFMQKGSSEALAAVFKSMGGQSPQVKEQQKGNKILGSIDKKLSTRDRRRIERINEWTMQEPV